ncbi:MAG: hypothetical protein A3H91_15115 [Gammaproteobacteria bacterium RIFCSPLOWO2_02_FULL_61_13]|nr:MAG: hypothetical protein A3H91_15115 [Gammaproteobacteria bacterium RIFCSPLOWO2_02_FULL_61_13]
MNSVIKVGKLDAARRQLRAAIHNIFHGGDPIVAHTLLGAASIILTYLVEHRVPEKSWDRFAQDANALAPGDYFNIMRKAQNFLKHAKNDPDGSLDLNPTDTESLAFFAVMNTGELLSHGGLGQLSMDESVFQLWYIACHSLKLEGAADPFKEALKVFGDLRNAARTDRIAAGRRVLKEYQQ